MSTPPVVRHLDEVAPQLISPVDTVKLALLAGPADGSPTSVFYEVWEPGGSQPDNAHPDSTEIFVVLSGHGLAHSDEHTVPIGPGDVLVLPPGSVHRIENTSATERMYTVTVMAEDTGAMPGGFAALVAAGTAAAWDDSDRAVLGGR
ncbi:cupin domain-containing protein [Streptomyces sp. NPDC047000]|uniref:cupin domain-containing protein n=1 Tax=Streptomyces sp. NPDC047000 TaxID=3155474 RepID=UPI0033F5248B